MAEQALTVVALIERSRGNREVLGDLLERYRSYLVLVSRQQMNPKVAVRCSASDIVQETFAEAYLGFERFSGSTEAQFSAWLGRIHQHNLSDAARKHLLATGRDAQREQHVERPQGGASFTWMDVAADEETPSSRVIAGERALRLAEELFALPEGQREAVRLRHLEGFTLAEIAKTMNRSPQAVAGLIKRGLRALRQNMSEDIWL